MKTTEQLVDWDVALFLNNEADIAAYLNLVMEENDPDQLQEALGDVARARGMAQVAEAAGAGRESLYKSLRQEANPSFKTITKVLRALGLRLQVVPLDAGKA